MITLSTTTPITATIISYVGEVWTDVVPIVALAIGLPLAFYVVRRIIGGVRAR